MAKVATAPAQSGDNSTLIKTGAILLGASFLYNQIFGKSKEDKEAAKEETTLTDLPLNKNPLTESFKPAPPPANKIILRSTKTLPAVPRGYFGLAAKQIKDAIGRFTDDESAIVAGMKKAATKSEVNVIARTYTALYKRDLWFDLKDNLNNKELLPILQYVNKLPDYIAGKKIK